MTPANETLTKNCTTEYSIFPTEIRINNDYILWYINIANLVVTTIVPVVLLTFFNYKIHVGVIERRRKRALMISEAILSNEAEERKSYEIRQTFVLFAIVAVFIICHMLRIILNLEEIVNFDFNYEQRNVGCTGVEFWEMLTLPISGVLLQINSSTNFFIYCIYDGIFTDVLKSRVPQRFSSCSYRTRQNIAIVMQ